MAAEKLQQPYVLHLGLKQEHIHIPYRSWVFKDNQKQEKSLGFSVACFGFPAVSDLAVVTSICDICILFSCLI